ncbi:hypothetical protein BB561_000784 [Smittium simulii]|uniref:Protein kinase domain-containing protein n=1 Tax=Smittium simulii TaxID=133385 RepID=A0A2T9YXK0_9FUNG|nr:hypothetical protein BB561_000784 [Smittium simulii]
MLLERPGDVKRVMAERYVLKKVINHPFLVALEYAFQTKTKLYFCLDYINGGELFYHLQLNTKFSENRARFYIAEIVSAIGYLHDLGIIYRDLKPENCLLDAQGHIKIVDFGLVKIFDTNTDDSNNKAQTFCGTPEYLAPEVILRKPYGKEIDWYCLGAILYEMIIGLPPFYSNNKVEIYNNIITQNLTFPTKNNQDTIGQLSKDFISRLMIKEPSLRLGHGASGTDDLKSHLYFYGISWEKIYNKEYHPPFVPKQSSIFELDNISPEFRNEPIPKSILNDGNVSLTLNNSYDNIKTLTNPECEVCKTTKTCQCFSNSLPQKKYMLKYSDKPNNNISNLKEQHTDNSKSSFAHSSSHLVDETVEAFRGFSFDSINR